MQICKRATDPMEKVRQIYQPSEREIFVVFCQYGNLIETAKHLNIHASTVSRSISNLEEKINIKLTDKHKNKLFLTNDGKEYFENISPIIEKIHAYESEMSELRYIEITVIAVDFFFDFWILDRIAEFSEKNKDIKFNIIKYDREVSIGKYSNLLFVGVGRDLNYAEDMICKNISKNNIYFYSNYKNEEISRQNLYSIEEISKKKIIYIGEKDKNHITTGCGMKKYKFNNSIMSVDSIPTSIKMGMQLNCVFIACDGYMNNLIQDGEAFKIKTTEQIDEVFIDVIFSKCSSSPKKFIDFVELIYKTGKEKFQNSSNDDSYIELSKNKRHGNFLLS